MTGEAQTDAENDSRNGDSDKMGVGGADMRPTRDAGLVTGGDRLGGSGGKAGTRR